MASAPCIRIIRGGTHADRCCSILILRNLFDKQKAIGGAQAFGVRGREISVRCSTDSLRECGSGACISAVKYSPSLRWPGRGWVSFRPQFGVVLEAPRAP